MGAILGAQHVPKLKQKKPKPTEIFTVIGAISGSIACA